MTWQLIDTAPKDGTVVCTDSGFAMYIDPKHWGSPTKEGWHLSDGDCPILDSDEGPARVSPRWWIQLPPLP